MKIAIIGHKRIPSNEGGIEKGVEQHAVRMVQRGNDVTVYNRGGHNVFGKEFDGKKLKKYKGINIVTVPTVKGAACVPIYSFLATIHAAFSRYDCVSFRASGSCAMIPLAKLFGLRVVASLHGIDSQRDKWGGFASKYLEFGERMAATKADVCLVLSKNMKEYIDTKYGVNSILFANGIDKPKSHAPEIIKEKYGLEKNEYILSLGRIVPEKGLQYLLHVTTTPSVAYIARVDDFDCGIMISASHNPYYDNGIKLIDCYGEKMPEEILLLVEDYIDGKLHVFDKDWPELPFAHREHIGCTVDYVSGRNRYMGYLISLGIYSFKGVKVGLDCANGSSWNIAKSVFDALGADTYVINNKPNGLNINNNAGSTHIEGLQKFVVENGLDVGFAFDGDADRCLCVDEKGNVITGDHILYIYGCYMKERGKLLTNTVVTTVMSNFGLYKAFDEQGIGYAMTAVGDKYVYEYMAKNGCRIGGEQSGHIIFSKYASTGDGILTSLKMMEVMLAKKKPMSELAAPLKIYPQVLENVRVTDKKAAQNDPAVQEAVSKVAEALGDTGRILVRESGTEPVVRVMVEAPDHDTCQKYVDEVVNVICEKGYKV